MKHFAIVVKDNNMSEKGYEFLVKSSKSVDNKFIIERFDAAIPENVERLMTESDVTWNYPWEGTETDLKTGLIKSAYPTQDKNKRISCFLSHWYLWHNDTVNSNNYLLVDVGYSPTNNIDPLSAEISVTLTSGDTIKKRVGSAGEIFSAGVIDTVHFGLGQEVKVSSVKVKWRNGESMSFDDVKANSLISTELGG